MDNQQFQTMLTIWHEALIKRGEYRNSDTVVVSAPFMRELIKRAADTPAPPEPTDAEWSDVPA